VLDNPELRFLVVRRMLERIGQDRPVLIWFDDLHLSSQNTFDVLMRLRRESSSLRLFIIATARSEALETDLDAALRMEALRADWNGRVKELEPLGEEETHVLLRATLPLHPDAIQAATRQSRGNPLFALQLLHAWAGGGYLTMEAGRYRVPREALQGRAITTAELWDERLRAVPSDLRLVAYAAAAIGDDVRGVVLKSLARTLGLDARESMVALTRAQVVIPSGNDQYRWAHALLQEHLLARLHERADAPSIFRTAADALALHPAVGSRRVMKLRVTNLLRAGEDVAAARLMFRFIEGAWSRGRDTAATLRDLAALDGRITPETAPEYAYWRAEALRHTGRLEQAREQAQSALTLFSERKEHVREAHALRLLGHISSDVGQTLPGRELVLKSLTLFESIGDLFGAAQAMVVLGEIDYLLGDHERATETLHDAQERCQAAGDELGRAQSHILLAMIQNATGRYQQAMRLLNEARTAFDQLGYRLGIAQCDVVLGHADHRALRFEDARTRALMARAACRELVNPRGEAACERLLAMIAVDSERVEEARGHAQVAATIYAKLQDPWGDLESTLLQAQVLLSSDPASAELPVLMARAAAIALDEAEPRQHRSLTEAWWHQSQARWQDAALAIDAAREAFPNRGRAGDHTPQLLARFARLTWLGPALTKIDAWLEFIESQVDEAPQSAQWPSSRPKAQR
jgi:eukaryotic-like serine/threonine-protein kinase